MLVAEVMTRKPITVRPDSDVLAAIALLRAGRLRRLPVVDAAGRVVGIVSMANLQSALQAEDSNSKQRAILSDGVLVRVRQVMTTPVITTPPDYPLEEAAQLMITHKVGSLPVVDGEERLVGIITDTDIFGTLVRTLGGGSKTLRLSVQLGNQPGRLADLAGSVAAVGGNILSIASYPADAPDHMNFVLRVEGVDAATLQAAIEFAPRRADPPRVGSDRRMRVSPQPIRRLAISTRLEAVSCPCTHSRVGFQPTDHS